jgi:hypothetical protein
MLKKKGKKGKAPDMRERKASRKIREGKGWVTRKLNLNKEWIKERQDNRYKRKPLLDSDLTKQELSTSKAWRTGYTEDYEEYLKNNPDVKRAEPLFSPDYPQAKGILSGMKLKTLAYPTKEKVAEMSEKEQIANAEAELRNKKAEQVVKDERERAKAEAKKLEEAQKGLVTSQKEQSKEQAKEIKRQSIIDDFVMGRGKYNKTVASAIRTSDEAQRVFAERARREVETPKALREQAKAEEDRRRGIILAGSEREYNKSLKEEEKYAKKKFKYLRHKRKKDIERWAVRERPEVVKWATTRRKGKLGTSRVGGVIHSILYPIKPRKKRRW